MLRPCESFGSQRARLSSSVARSTRRNLKMASPWSRVLTRTSPWTSLARASSSSVLRLATLVFAERHAGTRTFYSHQQRQQQQNGRGIGGARRLLTCTALVSAAGLGYALCNWRNDTRHGIENLAVPNCPVVHAVSLPPSDGNRNRDKYNFIADVVEISAPAVVYIEIRDNHR